MDNETWVVQEGGRIVQKKARLGVDGLTDWERLVYSLWVADYGMRNAGDLETATDVYADFQSDALRSATKMCLPTACSAFMQDQATLQNQYFELFEAVSTEIRSVEPALLFADLSDTDPAIVDAINAARSTFPQFTDAVSKTQFLCAVYLVKVPFIDRSDEGQPALIRTADTAAEHPGRPTCHLWLKVNSISDGLVFSSVSEAPDTLYVASGTSFVLASELIEDWMINENGTAYGGFSLRAIRSTLGKDDQLKFDAHTGIHEFKELKLGLGPRLATE